MPHPLEVFKILSDATRLTIVMLLREQGELCVCDICALTAESQPKISRHMAILREGGLVLDRREGNGCTTVCRRICRPGRQRSSTAHGDVCVMRCVPGSLTLRRLPADGGLIYLLLHI